MNVTVVQDHIAQFGGAERVLLSLRHLPVQKVQIVTSVFAPDSTYPAMQELDVRSMWFSRLSTFRSNHRRAFPLMAPAFSLTKTTTPVTLCCSAGWSHGVRAPGRKVVYWYAPARWIHQRDQYVGRTGAVARIIGRVAPALDRWDRAAVSTVDRHLAVSHDVADRLREIYGLEAEVVHPPVKLEAAPPPTTEQSSEPYAIVVARLIGYKNVDVVVDAFEQLTDEIRLVVVGTGPLFEELKKRGGTNVRFAGSVRDDELAQLYQNAQLLVSAAYEDFGLSPVEAGMFGVPTVALRAGGFLDSVREGVTGLLFDQPTPEEIVAATREALQHDWDAEKIKKHSANFSEEKFLLRIAEILEEEAGYA